MSAPHVSVIIPTRDRRHLLEESLRSVLSQTMPVSQVLVVDDGSRDPASVRSLAALSPKVEIVRHEVPRGPAAARNRGIEELKGDIVAFLDDDDLLHPRFVEDGLGVLRDRPDADVLVFRSEYIFTPDPQSGVVPKAPVSGDECLPVPPARAVDDGDPVRRVDLESRPVSAFMRYTIPINSCLLRRAALGPHRFPEPLRQGEDTFFWVSLAAAGRRFILDERVCAFVRRHRGNMTRSRERYRVEIQACYQGLLDARLLTAPDDAYLAHLKLFWFKCRQGESGRLTHLAHLAAAPLRMMNEIWFWLRKHHARRSSLPYILP